MPRESSARRFARAQQLLKILQRIYPDARCELDHDNSFQLLIATILSAQCSDKQVNKVTPELFRRFPAPRDLAAAALADIEQAIRAIGLFRAKASNIKRCCNALVEQHHGEVPQSMAELTALHGVGRKTANVVLGNAFGICDGIVVDTHVGRLAQRLKLTQEVSPENIERDLMALVPKQHWVLLSHWLIHHGRRRCGARHPDCAGCELLRCCPTGKSKYDGCD